MTWWQRTMMRLRSMLLPNPQPGAAGAPGVSADYSPLTSLSAMAAFPAVFACASAVAEDLSGLPFHVGRKGPDGRLVPDPLHPVRQLLEQPSPWESGVRFRAQRVIDLRLARNAWWVRQEQAGSTRLRRLHPEHVRVIEDSDGDPIGVEYGGRKFPMSMVYRVSGPSWTDGPSWVHGESAIRPLNDDLETVRASKRMTRNASKRGRPSLFISGSHDMLLSEEAIDGIKGKYNKAMANGDEVFFAGAGLEAKPTSWSPKDLEFLEVHKQALSSVQMVLGVPAVRLGLPDANYGTAKAQYRQYWDSLRALQVQIDAEDTRLVRDATGDLSLYVWSDFSRVEALQDSYTDRLTRAGILVQQFGAAPADALRYEGFTDAPHGSAPANAPEARPRPIEPDEQGEKRSLEAAVRLYLQGAVARWEEAQDLDATRTLEASRLRSVLEANGADPRTAAPLAEEWASTARELVEARGDLRHTTLRSAKRIAEIAEAK